MTREQLIQALLALDWNGVKYIKDFPNQARVQELQTAVNELVPPPICDAPIETILEHLRAEVAVNAE